MKSTVKNMSSLMASVLVPLTVSQILMGCSASKTSIDPTEKLSFETEKCVFPWNFAESIERGDAACVAVNLKKGANPNTKIKTFWDPSISPLHHIITRGMFKDSPKIVQMLLQAGADPNETLSSGDPILFEAAKGSSFYRDEITLALIKWPKTDVNIHDSKLNQTLLEKLLNQGRDKEIKPVLAALLNRNDLKVENISEKYSVAHLAFTQGLVTEAMQIIEKGSSPNSVNGNDVLLNSSIASQNKSFTDFLLSRPDIDINLRANIKDIDKGTTSLHVATQVDAVDIMQKLLQKKAQVNFKDLADRLPLHYIKSKNAAEILLSQGSLVDALDSSGNTPLSYAVQGGKTDVAELLLSKKANPNALLEKSPLICRILETSHNIMLEKVFKYNVNPAVDCGNTTPLLTAIENSNIFATQLLLKAGVPLDKKDGQNKLPLQEASKKGLSEIVELLLQNGAPVNLRDANDNTALHFAANEKVLKALLSAKAEVNAVNAEGDTPLFAAIKNNRKNLPQILLNHQAEIHGSNRKGHSLLILALENDDLDLVKVLANAGANIDGEKESIERPIFFIETLAEAVFFVERKAELNGTLRALAELIKKWNRWRTLTPAETEILIYLSSQGARSIEFLDTVLIENNLNLMSGLLSSGWSLSYKENGRGIDSNKISSHEMLILLLKNDHTFEDYQKFIYTLEFNIRRQTSELESAKAKYESKKASGEIDNDLAIRMQVLKSAIDYDTKMIEIAEEWKEGKLKL
ncbi:ankyrin repeat domain-containing protein [Bdellovibrio reynosensis]|uniref:Ankyrin repeat domain-containing protein n=1 Tax=Bdellovibrio reynosensis TaxID=2835041 RepID=A0ABY4CCW7_9BACT|nr:ankyrin repeat domain-containing protein [Bdellovibrio reynosensis]UOF02559.1 ankyrin repeat domain-containing protein [Bdellovibrio reynosensis]